MINSVPRPLLTFCVLGFNQERFIREAIAGAFEQTYSPLEIILSDDGSSDRTFPIMQELAMAYKGPHRVIARRNERNVGLLESINQVVRLSHGMLLIGAAGDDVSLPKRTERIYQAWEDSGRSAGSIWSEYIVTDENGVEVGASEVGRIFAAKRGFTHLDLDPLDFVAYRCPVVFGCTHAFSPSVFQTLGDLPSIPDLVNEDTTINFRSVLVGKKVTFIPERLVRYRRHSDNISAGCVTIGADSSQQRRAQIRMAAICQCFRHDALTAFKSGIISHVQYKKLEREARKSQQSFQLRARLVGADKFMALILISRLALLGRGRKALLKSLPRILPCKCYRWLTIQKTKKSAATGLSQPLS